MEEVGETRSRTSPSPDPPVEFTTTPKSPARDGLALAASGGGQGRSGGGREDCWTEEATEILIDAWGERFLELKRGNLKQQHWKEVSDIVNKENSSKSPKTDIQCKNRIDTVKKKFKQEKAKIVASGDNSKWIFFDKLEHLIGGATASANKALIVTPLSSRSVLYPRQAKSSTALRQQKQQGAVKRSGGDSTRWHFRKRIASETESESEPDLSADSGDSLSPAPVKLDKTGGGGGREIGEVAMAVLGFAESYEKAESLKLKQMVELEKERMKFAKELELQRMQFFKTQLEMLQNIREENGDDKERIRSQHNVKDNGNVS